MFDHLTIKKKNFGTLYSCHILQTYSSKNICIEQLNFKGTFLKASLVLSFFNLFFNFYWSTVDLQCSVSFGCIAKWNRYLYTYPVFLRSFSHIGHRIMEDSAVGPCWLSILCRALCICQSLSPNLSLPTFLSPDNCAFYICNCFVGKFICTLSPRFHMYHTTLAFLCLTSLSKRLSAHPHCYNGMISPVLTAE